MDWQNEYKEAYEHYCALGKRHIDEVVGSWSDAAFPFGLWDALHQDGLLSAMVGEGQEARDMGYLAAAIEGLITVSPIGVERLLRRAGFWSHRGGPSTVIGGHPIVACWIDVE